MSIAEGDVETTAVQPDVSFQQKLARRRQELEQVTTFELQVPGYEDLWARYRALGYEDVRAIGLKIEEELGNQGDPVATQITGERLTAAATLAEACIDLLQYKGRDDQGKPIFQVLGYRWSEKAGRELFELDIPEGVAAREVLTMVFPYPRDMLMMTHNQEYLEESMGYLPQIEELLMGESKGRLDEISSRS